MTAEQINAMEAGPEMDRLVAEAIGGRIVRYEDDYDQEALLLEPSGSDRKLQGLKFDGETGYTSRFYPSHYWDAAMFAAERFGLFDETNHGMVLWFADNEWLIGRRLYYPTPPRATEATGPLAICRAILKLHAADHSPPHSPGGNAKTPAR